MSAFLWSEQDPHADTAVQLSGHRFTWIHFHRYQSVIVKTNILLAQQWWWRELNFFERFDIRALEFFSRNRREVQKQRNQWFLEWEVFKKLEITDFLQRKVILSKSLTPCYHRNRIRWTTGLRQILGNILWYDTIWGVSESNHTTLIMTVW